MQVCTSNAHVHLQFIASNEIHDYIKSSTTLGVIKSVCNATCEKDWQTILRIRTRYPEHTVACFGLHPWFANQKSDNWFSELETCLNSVPSGIGEIGLDKFAPAPQTQYEVFCKQLDLASTMDRPVAIHCVKAWDKMLERIKKYPAPKTLMFHAFNGSEQTARQLTSSGAFISLSDALLEQNPAKAQKLLRIIPKSQLMLETDDPSKNPKHAPDTIIKATATAAQLSGLDFETMAKQTTQNVLDFFKNTI